VVVMLCYVGIKYTINQPARKENSDIWDTQLGYFNVLTLSACEYIYPYLLTVVNDYTRYTSDLSHDV